MLTPDPLLVPWSRKSRTVPLLPLWAVRPAQSLSACKRVHITFFFWSHDAEISTLWTCRGSCSCFCERQHLSPSLWELSYLIIGGRDKIISPSESSAYSSQKCRDKSEDVLARFMYEQFSLLKDWLLKCDLEVEHKNYVTLVGSSGFRNPISSDWEFVPWNLCGLWRVFLVCPCRFLQLTAAVIHFNINLILGRVAQSV